MNTPISVPRRSARMRDLGFYVQDQWRVRQNLTINAGLRYELQLPFTALNNSSRRRRWRTSAACLAWADNAAAICSSQARSPAPSRSSSISKRACASHDVDWNNWAPSIGGNWTPTARNGLLRGMLGDEGDTSISAGFSMAYNRNGMSDFTNIFGANPGVLIDVNRNQSLANLGAVPLLFRDRARLDPPAFASTPQIR